MLTKAEAEALAAEGIDIFTWWENSPSHIGSQTEQRATAGYDAGALDAALAASTMAYFGQPDRPIYFTVDTDTTADACRAYFNGILSVLPVKHVGVYGGYYVVKGLFNMGLVKYACQTEAWSYTQGTRNPPTWEPRAQLRQWCVPGHGTYAGRIGGIECDGLEATAEDFGQWRYGVTVAPEGDVDVTAQEHELIVRGRASDVGQSFDAAIIKALIAGDKALAAAKEIDKTAAVAAEKAKLDPAHAFWA